MILSFFEGVTDDEPLAVEVISQHSRLSFFHGVDFVTLVVDFVHNQMIRDEFIFVGKL